MAGVKITDQDRGYGALRNRIAGLKASRVAVGILEGPGSEPHRGDQDLLTVLEIATINHFGAQWVDRNGNDHEIPARPFITGWFDEAEDDLRARFQALLESVVQGRRSAQEALEIMGAYAVGQIQERVADSWPPPNAPSTVARKGSSVTLINTGQLRQSVSWALREAGATE